MQAIPLLYVFGKEKTKAMEVRSKWIVLGEKNPKFNSDNKQINQFSFSIFDIRS